MTTLIALVRPARGGHIYELDVREQLTNVLATLDAPGRRDDDRPVAGAKMRRRMTDIRARRWSITSIRSRQPSKTGAGSRDIECGDFATGTFRGQGPARAAASAPDHGPRRPGRRCSIRVRKTIALAAGEPVLTVRYEIEQIPPDACLHFAVEINLAGMAGAVARTRYYSSPDGTRLGQRGARLDLPHTAGFCLTDRSLDLSVSLDWSQSAGLWCFPIETICEHEVPQRVFQSSAVIPHWHVTPDEHGRWEVSIGWAFEHVMSSTALHRTRSFSLRRARREAGQFTRQPVFPDRARPLLHLQDLAGQRNTNLASLAVGGVLAANFIGVKLSATFEILPGLVEFDPGDGFTRRRAHVLRDIVELDGLFRNLRQLIMIAASRNAEQKQREKA